MQRSTMRMAGLLMLLAGCGPVEPTPKSSVHGFGGRTMGSTYEVKFVGSRPVAEVRRMVEAELDVVDLAFSQWRDDSEIAKVNAHRSTAPLPVSELFAVVLQQALDVAVATDGAFDPTVKPLSDAYRAAKRSEGARLGAERLDELKALVDHRAVRVVDGAVVKARPDVQLDLDGLVAGAAADRIAARLLQAGVVSFYLQVTGEVLCRGRKPGEQPWRIGVVDPASDVAGGDRPVRTLALVDRALCTSGDYRNATVVDGRVVHHVFDPRTGRNPTHDVVSASALAPSCAIADAVGTALMVMGDGEARQRWAALRALGVEGALLLLPGEPGQWRKVEIEWPEQDC